MTGVKLHLVGSEADMTNEDHVADLTAVFDRIQEIDAPVLMQIANPLRLTIDADGFTNITTIIATHPEVRSRMPIAPATQTIKGLSCGSGAWFQFLQCSALKTSTWT